MKTRKEIAELAAVLTPRGNGKPHCVADDVMILSRVSAAAETIATNLCNVPNYQATFEKRKASLLKRLQPIEKTYGVRFEIGGDPRGCVLKMFSNDEQPIHGNTWGGDESGYGI